MYVYNDVLITHVLKSVWYFLVYLIKQCPHLCYDSYMYDCVYVGVHNLTV